MAFFQRSLYTPESSFTPLFRLLEDFDNYSRQGDSPSQQQGRRPGIAHWQPKFDVRETGEAYELHGELPGMDKKNVHVEFSDPQTMLIRGKIERTYQAGTPPTAGAIEGGPSTTRGTITSGEEQEEEEEGHKVSPHKATVEDESEAASHEATAGEVARRRSAKKKEEPAAAAAADSAKYWLTERSVGEFSRSFNFPTRVNQDAVTANFKDGILNVSVPKAKHEARRITVE